MTVEEHSTPHRVPGESLGERLGARGRQERQVGPSASFYARFGLKSPWMLDTPVGGAGRDFGMVYLSSSAFLEHMAMLAERREARFARAAGAAGPRKRRTLSALRRSGGGIRPFSAWTGIGPLGDSDLVVPQHAAAEDGGEQEASAGAPQGRTRGSTMKPVASPWLSYESTPARVFGGTHRQLGASATGAPMLRGVPEHAPAARRLSPGLRPGLAQATPRQARPLDRLVQRSAAIDVQPLPIARAASVGEAGRPASAPSDSDRNAGRAPARLPTPGTRLRDSAPVPSRSTPAAGPAAETDAASMRKRRRAVRWRAQRVLGPVARLAASRLERDLPDAAASPLTLAASRLPDAGQPARGAQRALWGSPSASVLARPSIAPVGDSDERAPVSRSPVRNTWTPARVIRMGPSAAAARAEGVAPMAEASTARAIARTSLPARPQSGLVISDGSRSGDRDAQMRHRVIPTARALDRARAPQGSQPLGRPVGSSLDSASRGMAPVARAIGRTEVATPDAGSVVPRPLPALRLRMDARVPEESWLDAGFERAAPPAARRLSVARSSQGVFAPAAVVVASERTAVEETDAGETRPPSPASGGSTGTKVVSGWSKNELPTSTTRVMRGGRDATTTPARNAEARLRAAATAAISAAPSRRPAGAPAPDAAPRRKQRDEDFSRTSTTLRPALVAAADPDRSMRGSEHAARRPVASPLVGRSARRAFAPRADAGPASRHARPNPVAHARPRVADTVRLNASLARQLGVMRSGTEDPESRGDAWLVAGATAARAVRAAQRVTAADVGSDTSQSPGPADTVDAAERGAVRRSQLWAPDQVMADGPSTREAESGEAAPARGEPTERSTRPTERSTRPAGRPLDWLDDRTVAGLSPARRRAAAPTAVGWSEAAAPVIGGTRSRVAVGRLATAGDRSAQPARLGRHLMRTADGRYLPANPARRPAAVAGGFVVPTAADPGRIADTSGRDPMTGAPVVNGWARPQAALTDTLDAVGSRSQEPHLPVWARRANGVPLVRGSGGDLVSALARARDPEQVVRVIMEKGDVGGTTASTLPKPALEVIEKIKTVAREEVSEAIRSEVAARTSAARKTGRRAEAPRSTARVVQGFTGLRRGSSARRGGGVGDDRVMKLAKKLQSLIDLAEGRGDRSAARRQVRMAEDSAAARGEGHSSPQSADGGQESSMDIDALTRQVVEAATRELDQRRERRQEDSDERGFWW